MKLFSLKVSKKKLNFINSTPQRKVQFLQGVYGHVCFLGGLSKFSFSYTMNKQQPLILRLGYLIIC